MAEENVEKREFSRSPVAVEVDVTGDVGECSAREIRNVSMGGVGIAPCDEEIPVVCELVLRLYPGGRSGGVGIEAEGRGGRACAGTGGRRRRARQRGTDWKAAGVAVNYEVGMQEYLYDVISGAEEALDLPVSFQPSDMRVLDQYIGEGYGIPTEGVIEAVHMLGRLEGLMIDPNYTGTVMSALIDQIRQGNLSKDETIVFLHTGGLPAIFTFAEELAAYEG